METLLLTYRWGVCLPLTGWGKMSKFTNFTPNCSRDIYFTSNPQNLNFLWTWDYDYTKSLTLPPRQTSYGELRHFARTSDLSTSNPPPPPNWTFSCSRGELSYFVCTSDLDTCTTDPHTPHHNRSFSWHRQYNWHSSRSRKVVQGNNSCKIAVSVYILLNTSLSVTFNEPKTKY